MSIISDRRAVLLALCAFVALESSASAEGFRYEEKPNAALATLRAGAWLERGGFDSFEPAGRASDGAVSATGGGYRVVAVGWEMPQLTPPNLTPPNLTPPIVSGPAPVVVESRPIDLARPVQIEAVAIAPNQPDPAGITPCQDLKDKARRLRAAADKCDSDIAGGRPYCHVEPGFSSPVIGRLISSGDARYHAARYELFANGQDEQACANFGGQGVIPSVGVPTALQLPGSGVGPIFKRKWRTTISNGKSARELMSDIKRDVNKYSRGGIVADTPLKFMAGPNPYEITLGNTYGIDGPMKFNPFVRATHVDDTSYEFTTLAGHPEAGRVRFTTYDSAAGTVFFIEVYGHPATKTDQVMYGALGYWVQTKIWDNFTENVRRHAGGQSTAIDRSSIKE